MPAEQRDVRGNTIKPHDVQTNRIDTDNVVTNSVDNSDYSESVLSLSGSGTMTVDLAQGNLVEVSATGNVTIEFSNVSSDPAGNSVMIYFEDGDGTGPHTISWPASVVWSGGSAVDTIAASDDIEASLISYDGGTEWRGREGGSSFA